MSTRTAPLRPDTRAPAPTQAKRAAANVGPVYARWLGDARRALLGWAGGIVAVCLLYLPLFPSMRDTGLLGDKLEAMPKDMLDGFGMDIATTSTGWGYAHQMVFGMLGLLLLLVLSIGQGARMIAGDEEAGALELTLAHATTRRAVLTARLAALVTIVAAMTALVIVVVAALNGPSELQLTAAGLMAEGAALGMLVLTHALVAFAVGAVTGRRAWALAAASIVGVLGWFAHTMGAKLADWVPGLSPFHWAYGEVPLHTGLDAGGLAALGTACVVLVSASYLGFARRDLRA